MKCLNLWPILCGLEVAPFDREYLDRLRAAMLSTHDKHSTGLQIWDRKAHNIFADPTDDLLTLKTYALDAVSRMAGHSVLINAVEGRELVRKSGQEILPHTDRDEGDITAQFFLDGEDPLGMMPDALWGASNQFGPNVFSLCDPALHGSEKRLPWEGNYNVWLAPFRGLFILYPSRLPHYQRPYEGDGQFVQVLINMKVVS